MSEVTWTHPQLPKILDLIPSDTISLLDVGCGRGIIGALCQIYRRAKDTVGLEIFPEYIESSSRYYDKVLRCDLRNFPLPFKDEEFDVVTCIEVVEHLHRKTAFLLIHEMERVAKRRVIITTPNKFFHIQYFDGNPFQRHLSFIGRSDLRKLGYSIQPPELQGSSSRTLRLISKLMSRVIPPRFFITVAYKDKALRLAGEEVVVK